MKSHSASVDYYDRNAARQSARYGTLRFEDVHADALAFLPSPPAEVLDVGAGIGRDAAALAERGYSVTAAEPSREFRRRGRDHYSDHRIEWVEDRLPVLRSLRAAYRTFDFILCSAVLMHVAPEDLTESFRAFADLLRPGGCLAVSVRNKLAKDPDAIFFDIDDGAILAAADLAGFALASSHVSEDQLGRGNVRWRSFIFAR